MSPSDPPAPTPRCPATDGDFITGGALHGPVGVAALAEIGIRSRYAPGDRIGPFRLVREIGEGGTGIVFLAERDNDTIHQQVALKLWRDADTARSRALVEGNHLARLAHPNIARVIDAGLLGDDGAWLAMDYIDGEPIDLWCQRHDTPWDRRLAMLAVIATAVDAAHRRLIAHGDIKPANVLVDASGQPHILDFGIAQHLHANEPCLGWTPGFASPEQTRGEPLQVGSDIYQLGRLAEHLLPATLPMPSVIRGEWRAVLAQARQESPGLRHPSALALAQDFERLAGRRARSGAPFAPVRMVRFLWLRQPRVLAGLLLLVALLGVLGLRWHADQSLARQRIADEQSAKQALARLNAALLVEALRGVGEDRAAFRNFVRDQQAHALDETRLEPRVRFEILSGLAPAHVETGDFDEARFVIREALRARPPEVDPQGAGVAYLLCLDALSAALTGQIAEARLIAGSGARMIDVRLAEDPEGAFRVQTCLGSVGLQVGDVAGATRRAEWSLAEARRRYGPESREYIEALSQAAEVARVRMEFARAVEANREVALRMDRWFGPSSRRALDQHIRLQGTRASAGEADDAEQALTRVIEELRRQGNTTTYPFHAAHFYRAEAREHMGRYPEAAEDHALAINLLHGEGMDAPTLHRLSDAAIASRLQAERGNPDAAIKAHDAALAFTTEQETDAALRTLLSMNLAEVLLDAGAAPERVAPLLDGAQERVDAEFGARSFHAGHVRLQRIRWHLARSESDAAARLYTEGRVDGLVPEYPLHARLLARWHFAGAAIAGAQGDAAESLRRYREALLLSERHVGADHPWTARLRMQVADATKTADPEFARQQRARALPILREHHLPTSPWLVATSTDNAGERRS